MPIVAHEAAVLDERFYFRIACIDKSVFRANGGIWHKKHRKQGIVPHPSIDTDASWAKSAYHGWRFGYGLHLVANVHRFPVMACVRTAANKDYHQLLHLLTPLMQQCRLVIADAGYRSIQMLMKAWKALQIFILLQTPFITQSKNKSWYNRQIARQCAGLLYRKRGPSIELVFAIIKELFKLKEETQLSYKGLAKVD